MENSTSAKQNGNKENRTSSILNVGQKERIASAIGGSALALYGLSRRNVGGVALALFASGLIYRGATGHCQFYSAIGVNHAEKENNQTSVRHDVGVKVEKSVLINKSPEDLFGFWRKFENLPRFMSHLKAVSKTDDSHSHWVAKAPAGKTVEWDAEIINEKENELVAWRSLEGSEIPNAGSVRFTPSPTGRGTEVKVSLSYEPPAGKVGVLIAKLFGEGPEQQIAEDLRRFKQLMETGEIATIEGQPSGRVKTTSATA